MNYRISAIALTLGLLPLALTLGCEKRQSEEEIIAKYEASKLEQERVDKLQQELDDLKDKQAADAVAQQVKEEHQASLEKQIQAARQKAEQAEKAAKEAKEATAPKTENSRRGEGRGEGRDGRGEGRDERRRPTVTNVPRGTELVVSLSRAISTENAQAGASWDGQLTQDVAINNTVLWKAGTRVTGIVSQSTPTGRLANGEGALGIKLTEVGGSSIDGGIYLVTGDAKGGRNAKVIGTTAALGALVGILSNKKNQADHALGGAAIGAALGTAVAAGTGSTVITIPTTNPIKFVVPADERIVVNNPVR
ncbi:MAG: hypothetical protein LBB40_05570 [Holophagales bacterium]|jgi:hypothetical protein|nr:hypothetical protein [Holophagales bacterium]